MFNDKNEKTMNMTIVIISAVALFLIVLFLICMDYSKKSVLLKSIDNSNNALLFKLMDEGINIPYGHSDGQIVFYHAVLVSATSICYKN